ncbi:MAG: lysophospholipid acyltransferase family protein [Gemmatimonadales bacterium]
MPPTLLHRVEYAALRGVMGALAPLGIRRGGRVGAAIGSLGYWPLRIRRGVTERQIAAAFPDLDAAAVARIARESYRNVGRVAIEATLLSRGSAQDVLDLFHPSPTWDVAERALARGRGLIFVAGHLGNWELSGAYVAARGVPVHAIARGMANPLADAFFRRTRERLGMHIMHDRDAVRRVPRALRDGHAVGILSDQATVGLASTHVPFFGRPAKTPRGAAVFALRGDVPIVLIQAVRQPDGRYEFIAEEIPVTRTDDRERDIDDIILRFSQALERLVRRYPGQYFWQHRRWKHQLPGTPPELGEP